MLAKSPARLAVIKFGKSNFSIYLSSNISNVCLPENNITQHLGIAIENVYLKLTSLYPVKQNRLASQNSSLVINSGLLVEKRIPL